MLVTHPRPPDVARLKSDDLVVTNLSPSQGGEIFFVFPFFPFSKAKHFQGFKQYCKKKIKIKNAANSTAMQRKLGKRVFTL